MKSNLRFFALIGAIVLLGAVCQSRDNYRNREGC
jgi:hypothetical protein